jgi:sugar phosphate isomerase/epimerase
LIKIGCNYLSFKGAKISVEDFIQTCHSLRLDCLDFHQRAFVSSAPDYLLGIKRKCLDLGLPIGYLGVAGGFAGDAEFQRTKVEEAKAAVDMALVLGAPLIRVFGWHTFASEGREPMFAALARCLREVCDYGADKGVIVALQNHNNRNLAATGPDVLRIIQDVDHANLSFIMDTGQWRGSPGSSGDTDPAVDIYRYMEQTLPYAGYVRCKFYQIADGREAVLDYERIASILLAGGYNGCISIVYEGKEAEDRSVLIGKCAAHLRQVLVS